MTNIGPQMTLGSRVERTFSSMLERRARSDPNCRRGEVLPRAKESGSVRRVHTVTDFIVPPELKVTVDKVIFQTQMGAPERPYCFVYFITIHNDWEIPV